MFGWGGYQLTKKIGLIPVNSIRLGFGFLCFILDGLLICYALFLLEVD